MKPLLEGLVWAGIAYSFYSLVQLFEKPQIIKDYLDDECVLQEWARFLNTLKLSPDLAVVLNPPSKVVFVAPISGDIRKNGLSPCRASHRRHRSHSFQPFPGRPRTLYTQPIEHFSALNIYPSASEGHLLIKDIPSTL